ncbi:MAG: translation initiation factor [Planctomycetaceae bacterium]|nr:translation initiation factor [Planctomycetaceae bacterium]
MRLFEGTEFDQPPKCDRCGDLEADCQCPPPPKTYRDPSEQTARVLIEKRKRGKQVTTVNGLSSHETDLKALLSKLKEICGAGGAVKDEVLEIQGDHVDRIRKSLMEFGYRVK